MREKKRCSQGKKPVSCQPDRKTAGKEEKKKGGKEGGTPNEGVQLLSKISWSIFLCPLQLLLLNSSNDKNLMTIPNYYSLLPSQLERRTDVALGIHLE